MFCVLLCFCLGIAVLRYSEDLRSVANVRVLGWGSMAYTLQFRHIQSPISHFPLFLFTRSIYRNQTVY